MIPRPAVEAPHRQIPGIARGRRGAWRWLIAAVLAATLFPAAARAASPDWKFYGGVSSQNGDSWCFYDANGVARGPTGHLTLGARCLPRTAMDAVNPETGFEGAIARAVARQQRRRYRPPYTLVEAVTAAEAAEVIRLEQIADLADIPPRVRLSYELDCTGHRARELSLHVQVNGTVRDVDQPGAWQPISPETNTVRLAAILCRPRLAAHGGAPPRRDAD